MTALLEERRAQDGRRRIWVGPALMVGSALSWALGLVASKSALDATGAAPNVMLTMQLVASVGALAVACVVMRRTVRGAWGNGWAGLLEPGLAYQLGLAGLALTGAASASVLGSLEPVVVPLIVWVVMRQRPRRVAMAATVVATVGSAAVSLAGSGSGRNSLGGSALVLGGVVAAAVYVVVSSRSVETTDPIPLALVQQAWALGLTVIVAVVYLAFGGSAWAQLDAIGLLRIAVSGALNYALPFCLYLAALRTMHVSAAAQYLTLIPVFGVVTAVVVLGERVAPVQLAGTLLIVASLAVAARNPEPSAGLEPDPELLAPTTAGPDQLSSAQR